MGRVARPLKNGVAPSPARTRDERAARSDCPPPLSDLLNATASWAFRWDATADPSVVSSRVHPVPSAVLPTAMRAATANNLREGVRAMLRTSPCCEKILAAEGLADKERGCEP